MQLKNVRLHFRQLLERFRTEYIILHHRAGDGDVESIHKDHLDHNWSGIGYHIYITKNGEVYEGRPLGTIGAHCSGMNNKSIGVCFEGNFEIETMRDIQYEAGVKAISDLRVKYYPKAKIVGHKDLYPTVCPGSNFPLEKFKNL